MIKICGVRASDNVRHSKRARTRPQPRPERPLEPLRALSGRSWGGQEPPGRPKSAPKASFSRLERVRSASPSVPGTTWGARARSRAFFHQFSGCPSPLQRPSGAAFLANSSACCDFLHAARACDPRLCVRCCSRRLTRRSLVGSARYDWRSRIRSARRSLLRSARYVIRLRSTGKPKIKITRALFAAILRFACRACLHDLHDLPRYLRSKDLHVAPRQVHLVRT